MKVTLLGHASVFVEMERTRCLMDPVFRDPFEETAVVSCPKREISLDAIPRIDLLVISHAHLDHFDIPSLAFIAKQSRGCDVLCPEDKAIIYTLGRLGFTNVHPEKPFKHFKFDHYEIVTTHSNVSNVIELGVVFKDHSGTFWNQVDTFIAPETIALTIAQTGKIDLLFAMYASQNFKFFESRGTAFPTKTHAINLANVIEIRPKLAVPGSAGFRFAGEGMEWCNTFLFPMSRERFVADLARLAPDIETRLANPGDIFEIEGGRVSHHVAASPLAKMIEDDTDLLRFDPTAPVPELTDPNPLGLTRAALAGRVEPTLAAFARFVRDAIESRNDSVVEEYRALQASYAVCVVYPDGDDEWLRIDTTDATVERTHGSRKPHADAGHRIVASALGAWAAHEKSYFYLRAFSRKWSTLYLLSMLDAKVVVESKEPRDLLAHFLERKAKGADVAMKEWLELQLAPFVGVR